MGGDEGGPGDIAGLAGAGGDVLQGAPAAGEQREPAFAQVAQRAEQRVAGAGADIEVPPVGGLLTGMWMPMPAPSYPGSARAGSPVAAARYSAGRAWMRAAVMSCTDPGSAPETHSGNPSEAMTAWMLPPWTWALPEYRKSMASPRTLRSSGGTWPASTSSRYR